jgi:REP element-mobilizing transposase RayT
MEKFRGKYRIPSARLRTWNYASNAMYFVTVCTNNREHFFGEIVCPDSSTGQQVMRLSELGSRVETEWLKTPDIRPDMNLALDEFQVMPNHFHAILIIGDNPYNSKSAPETFPESDCDAMPHVSINRVPDWDLGMDYTNKFGPQSRNLGSVMRGFKSAVTTYAQNNNIVFRWQPRFHDHIIRDFDEYRRIKNYIRNNPTNWEKDRLH